MAKLHSALLALFTAVLLVTGCSKTVEGETKSWNANVRQVNELMAQYPGMKPALEDRLASAKAKFDAAESMAGDEQIKQMAAANSEIRSGFVRDLQDLDGKLKKLRTAVAEVTAKAGDDSSRQAARVAATDAQQTITRVEKLLADGATDAAAANAVLKKIISDIDTAQSVIDKVAAADKDKTEQKADAEKAAADQAAAEKAEAAAAVANWTCEYCDASNKHDEASCSGCGAARPAAK
jgi:colicin import membrane protein